MQGQVRYNVILHCSKENCIIKHSDKLRRMLSVSVMSLSFNYFHSFLNWEFTRNETQYTGAQQRLNGNILKEYLAVGNPSA